MRRHQTWVIIISGFFFLWGCAGPMVKKTHTASAADPAHMPGSAQVEVEQAVATPTEGSLWVERGGLSEMFINNKARRVGDIITIAIVENSSASNKASTNTGRASELSVGLTNFFNLEKEFPSDSRFFNPFAPATGSYNNTFDGTGSTVRSGALSAYITARIVQVLPNGNLLIEGNREVRVNNENQVITLTGMVRPRDISGDNVIQSTFIADARINYSGTGVINDEQRPGWLMRLIDNIWPF
jgi:flagellar L-ring protein FlgH